MVCSSMIVLAFGRLCGRFGLSGCWVMWFVVCGWFSVRYLFCFRVWCRFLFVGFGVLGVGVLWFVDCWRLVVAISFIVWILWGGRWVLVGSELSGW